MQKAPVRLQFVSEEEKATFASRINQKLLEKQPRATRKLVQNEWGDEIKNTFKRNVFKKRSFKIPCSSYVI